MIGWCTEAEDSCLWPLHIPKLSILAGLCFRELILRNSFAPNRSWLCLILVDKALVIDLNGQHFWVLIRIERVFIDELLLWRSWALVGVDLLILASHAILWSVTLPCEDSFLLGSVAAPFDGNDHLATFLILLVNGIVSIHFDYLSDLDCRIANVTILVIVLLLQFFLMLVIIWTSKKGGRLRIGSLLYVRSKRIASSLGPLLGTTIELFLRIMQSLTSITTFCVHFLVLMWEWMHSLAFYSWVLALFWLVVFSLNSICTE